MKWVLYACCLLPVAASAQDLRWQDAPRIQFALPPVPAPAEELLVPPVAPPPPLFPPESVARDTPPLLLRFAEERTIEHARAWVEWFELRAQAHREMDVLLKQVLKERKR